MRILSAKDIKDICSLKFENIDELIKDEMAIPSYTHKNPIIRWLMWKRYESIFKLAKINYDMKVLEFGCGIGLFLPSLCQKASKVFATDIYPQYAESLAKNIN